MDQDDHTQDDLLDSSELTVLPEKEQTPRLRIHHLMLWMLCSAILLTTFRNQDFEEEIPPEFNPALSAVHLIYGILHGAVLAAAVVMVNQRIRHGLRLARQPGHWILLIEAFRVLANGLLSVTVTSSQSEFSLDTHITSGIQLVTAFGYLLAVRDSRSPRWEVLFKVMFLVEMILCIQSLAWSIAIDTSTYGSIAFSLISGGIGLLYLGCYLGVILNISRDRKEGLQFDWLHWTGIITFLIAPVFGIILGMAIAISVFFN